MKIVSEKSGQNVLLPIYLLVFIKFTEEFNVWSA